MRAHLIHLNLPKPNSHFSVKEFEVRIALRLSSNALRFTSLIDCDTFSVMACRIAKHEKDSFVTLVSAPIITMRARVSDCFGD